MQIKKKRKKLNSKRKTFAFISTWLNVNFISTMPNWNNKNLKWLNQNCIYYLHSCNYHIFDCVQHLCWQRFSLIGPNRLAALHSFFSLHCWFLCHSSMWDGWRIKIKGKKKTLFFPVDVCMNVQCIHLNGQQWWKR